MLYTLNTMFTQDFLRVPRPFIRKFGLQTAIMLSEIYSEYSYWEERNLLEKGGYFYSTVENIYNNTGLSKHQQLNACKMLQEYGIIKIKYHGMPQKRYFKFETKAFEKLYDDFQLNLSSAKNAVCLDDSDEDFAKADLPSNINKPNTVNSGQSGGIPDGLNRKFGGFGF